jgi:thiol-disulfide isomerase/thioredoxin
MRRIYAYLPLGVFALALLSLSSCEQDNRISGCADPFAINFDQSIQVSDDDGTCVYPPEERRALFFDITATWCGPCGDWGVPTVEEVLEANKGKNNLEFMAIHPSDSDPMFHAHALAIAENYPEFTGYPTLVVNNVNNYSSEPPITSEVETFVEGDPDVTAINIMTIENGMINITAQTRWFNEMTGKIFMAVYVMEDGLDSEVLGAAYDQNGIDGPFVHDHVLRRAITDEAFGDVVMNGDSWPGKTETRTYSLEMDPSWNPSNLYAITVLWREVGTQYEFLNVHPGVTQ